MLLSTLVKVKSSNYYKKIGYDISEKYITVDIKDVPLNSRVLVNAKCDYCTVEKELTYRDYNNNVKRGDKFACSKVCGSLKSKETTFNKWGVDSANKLESKKEKTKKTVLEKWGVEHVSQIKHVSESKSIKMSSISNLISRRITDYYLSLEPSEKKLINEKRKITVLEKWGEDNVSKLKFVKDKKEKTFNDKWGGFTLESSFLKSKVKKTNLEKWGIEYPSKLESIKNKTINTNLEKWGVKTPSMNFSVKEKIKQSFLKKYNVINIMFSEEFRKKFEITKEENYLRYDGKRIYEFICKECDSLYTIDYDNYYQRKLRKVNCCTNCFPISENRSIKQKVFYEYIKSIYEQDIICSYRDGLEIDVYLPHLKLGFEFNGLYWHSDKWKDKNYHLDKTNHFKNKGIKIIHVWEDDWDFKIDIVKSQIKNLLNLSKNKLFARNCEVKEILDPKIVRNFLEENHIQGWIRSIIKIGLFHNDELVSIMTFDNNEGRKKMSEGSWNLSRFCSKIDYNIIGGASKLLSFFVKNYRVERLISFADKDWSEGNLYHKLGFNRVGDLKPDYKYIIDNKRINKQRLAKKKLIKLGKNPNLTENEITKEMFISKIYNVGQLKFELNF